MSAVFDPKVFDPKVFQTEPQAPATEKRLYRDFNIPRESAEDVSVRINGAIASMQPGSRLVWDGKFTCLDEVNFTAPDVEHVAFTRGDLTNPGDGLYRPTQAPLPNCTRHINVLARCVIDGLSVVGPLTERRWDSSRYTAHGVEIGRGADNAVICNITIRGVHGDGVYVHDGDMANIYDVLLENIDAYLMGRQAIGISGGHRFTWNNCSFREAARSGMDHEPIVRPSHWCGQYTFNNLKIIDCANMCLLTHNDPFDDLIINGAYLRGGLTLAKCWDDYTYLEDAGMDTSNARASHKGWRWTDVVFDGNAERNPSYIKPGTGEWTVGALPSFAGIEDLQIVRMRGVTKNVAGEINARRGSGTITDSEFSMTDPRGSAPVLYGPRMTLQGTNVGLEPFTGAEAQLAAEREIRTLLRGEPSDEAPRRGYLRG